MKTNNQFKPDLIDQLEGEVYDNLTLQRERLRQIKKLVDMAIKDFRDWGEYPKVAIEQAGTSLGITQYLLNDFLECVEYQITELDEVQHGEK